MPDINGAMTRADIEQDYDVVDGVIRSPGKFEGEPVYAPYYWATALDGFADVDYGEEDPDPNAFVFHLSAADWAIWPELEGFTRLTLSEDDNGFVSCRKGA